MPRMLIIGMLDGERLVCDDESGDRFNMLESVLVQKVQDISNIFECQSWPLHPSNQNHIKIDLVFLNKVSWIGFTEIGGR